jgi:regulatory protein
VRPRRQPHDLSAPPDARETYAKAVDALARRAFSSAELRRWLEQRGHPRASTDEAIERLTGLGYLDDAAYALAFARSRARTHGMSRRRLQGELARRGVARELVVAAIGEVFDDGGVDERALCEAAARRKLRALAKLPPDVQRRRLLAFLVRRGHATHLIRETVAKLARGGD